MKKRLIVICLLLSLFVGIKSVFAASFTIGVGTKSVTKGGSTKLTIKGTDVVGRFNISSSNSSVVSISEDRAWIENDSYSITLTALNVGTSTITITPSGVSDSSGNAASLGAKSVTITVSLPREKSSDNNLKNLEVVGYELSPEFDKNVQSYSVIVSEDTKTVKINATPNESHASISGAGDVEVTPGANTINVIVTSETGQEKTYTINIEVKDSNPISVTVNGNEYTLVKIKEHLTNPGDFEESTIEIGGIQIPSLKNEKIDLDLVGLKDSEGNIKLFVYNSNDNSYLPYISLKSALLNIMPIAFEGKIKGYHEYQEEIEGSTFTVYKYSKDSNYYIFYGVDLKTGEKNYYMYDKSLNTLITLNKEYINHLEQQNSLFTYIIIALVVILIVLFGMNFSKKKPKKKPLKNDIKEDNPKKKEKDIIEL